MPTLYLIRHGQPDVTGVLLGQMDPPLSPAGRDAAAALCAVRVAAVWTSPLCRARETATFIPASSLTELAELKEIGQGEWTGKRWSEIEATWPDLALRKASDWLGIAAPGGESWACFLARVEQAWKIVRAGPSPAAVVAHHGVNAALLYLIQGRDPLTFTQQYGEVIEVEYD
jgi:broad specificity phosphatase PhoE